MSSRHTFTSASSYCQESYGPSASASEIVPKKLEILTNMISNRSYKLNVSEIEYTWKNFIYISLFQITDNKYAVHSSNMIILHISNIIIKKESLLY